MSAVQLAQRRKRALQARRNASSVDKKPNETEDAQPSASASKTPFQTDDDDDDDDNGGHGPRVKKRTRVTSVSMAPKETETEKKKEIGVLVPAGSKVSSDKGSQIERLLARRKGLKNGDSDDGGFREQVEECAEDGSLKSYEQVPVEGFGEAMLRAMGWNGKHTSDENTQGGIAPRPERLGLGAKLKSDGASSKLPHERDGDGDANKATEIHKDDGVKKVDLEASVTFTSGKT